MAGDLDLAAGCSEVMVRRLLRGTGWTFIGMGSFVLYFLVYQLVGTNAVTSRGQSDLRNELQREWTAAPVAPKSDPKKVVPKRVARGKALAVLDIPKIQLDNKVVVEGSAATSCARARATSPARSCPARTAPSGCRAPHHLRRALLPAQRAGQRRYHHRGNREAIYTYTVTRTAIVRPTDTQVLDNVIGPDGKPKATITLTTCHPRYSARQRLIVFGDLSFTSVNTGKVAA